MKKRVFLRGVALLMVLALVFLGTGLVQATETSFQDPLGGWGIQCEPLGDNTGCGGG